VHPGWSTSLLLHRRGGQETIHGYVFVFDGLFDGGFGRRRRENAFGVCLQANGLLENRYGMKELRADGYFSGNDRVVCSDRIDMAFVR
jgi:hypothetical protein